MAGEVVVQSCTPHADPIQFARHGDVDAFLQMELENRERFQYPPFRRLIRQVLRGPNPDKVAFFAEQFAKQVEKRLDGVVEIRGPAPCPIEKMKDNYRFQNWYFTAGVSPVMAVLREIAGDISWPADVVQVLDADPMMLS